MPRLLFHFFNSKGNALDNEGRIAEPSEAKKLALRETRSVLSEEVRSGRLDLRGRIEVRNESGDLIIIVRFDEALEVIAPHDDD